MTFGTRSVTVLASVVTILLSAGCSGGHDSERAPGTTASDGGGTTATSTAMLAFLTNDACIYQGNRSPRTGLFTINVENHSIYNSTFILAGIAPGVTRADIDAFSDLVRAEIRRHPNKPHYLAPPWETVSNADVESGGFSEVPANVGAGRYVLICFQEHSPAQPRNLFAATLITVPRRT